MGMNYNYPDISGWTMGGGVYPYAGPDPNMARYQNWAGLTSSQILGKLGKAPMARMLYQDLQDAQNGPPLYSENDIRNTGLSYATSAAPQWEAQKQAMAGDATASGMYGSGFYQRAVGQAEAAKNASVSAQALAASNQMRQANTDYQSQRLSSASQLLGLWLSNQRKNRLNAMQAANLPGTTYY
jgi:hypothetical protein